MKLDIDGRNYRSGERASSTFRELLGVRGIFERLGGDMDPRTMDSATLESAKKILSRCMASSVDVLKAADARELAKNMNDSDKALISTFYTRTFFVGLGTTLASGIISLRLTGRPFFAGIFSTSFGALATISDMMNKLPPLMLNLVRDKQESDSVVVDRVICPAALELQRALEKNGTGTLDTPPLASRALTMLCSRAFAARSLHG